MICYFLKPERVNEVKNAICSSKLAETLLGFESNKSIDKVIKKMIDSIKQKGVRKFNYNYEIEINNELTPDTWKKKII